MYQRKADDLPLGYLQSRTVAARNAFTRQFERMFVGCFPALGRILSPIVVSNDVLRSPSQLQGNWRLLVRNFLTLNKLHRLSVLAIRRSS